MKSEQELSGLFAMRCASLGVLTLVLASSPVVAGPWSGAPKQASDAAPAMHLAQFVCDTGGCGTGSGRAGPSGGYIGRPYYGRNAEERRALEERDRLRRERAERSGGSRNGASR
ncbi:hypothetical protein ACFONL_14670 [Camelimonas fluminis]|uniref:Uncharacterized protein n=1 Tax=Camelimonas fluminis TaxID=1576911 RepID=A0ABV7UJ99_9HYPH|nr:hypothetical protein [Camelimonas fluminis]